MNRDDLNLLTDIESHIAGGDLSSAREKISLLPTSKLTTNYEVRYAKVLRRLDRSQDALRLLRKSVDRPDIPPSFVVEYCLNLQRLRVNSESLLRISSIHYRDNPEALLIKIQHLISQWNYSRALPLLLQYVSIEEDPYRKAIAHVNTCSAIVGSSQYHFGLRYADVLASSFEKEQYTLLLSHALELRAQSLIGLNRLDEAEQSLLRSEQLLKENQSRYFFFREKWKRVIESRRLESPAPLIQFANTALESKQWESARSAHFEIAKHFGGQEYIDRLFFGTPHTCFRNQVLKLAGKSQESFLLNGSQKNVLDLSGGLWNGNPVFAGQNKTFQLLNCLISDFYVPASAGSIFSYVFPDEIFDPKSSLDRVHQIVFRARTWLKEMGIGIQIVESEGYFRLLCEKGTTVSVGKSQVKSVKETELKKMHEYFGDDAFSLKEVMEKFDLKRHKVSRLLSKGVEMGIVHRVGNGPATIYHF